MKKKKLLVRRAEREALHAVLGEILTMGDAVALALVYALFAELRLCPQCLAANDKGSRSGCPENSTRTGPASQATSD